MPTAAPTEKVVLQYFHDCSNWGRWGREDQLGAINYVTPQKRRRASALVKEGVPVSCSRPIVSETAPDEFFPFIHYMTSSGEKWKGKKNTGDLQASGDFLGIFVHGLTGTHLDSPAHIFWEGKMYNGHPAEAVTVRQGATLESIDVVKEGIFTRGVLLDMPKLRGVKWLPRNTALYPEDLEEAEKQCNVRVESGDVLLVRTGWTRMRNEEGPSDPSKGGRPGLQAACVPWLYRRQVAILAADISNDVVPSGYPLVPMPVHQVGLVSMGMWIIDNADLEGLAAACEKYQRWEFLLTINPLRIIGGTGSPVNPIAVF